MDLYEAIYSRRDVRHFRSDPVPDSVLIRVLDAAHHAGSVGFMQPWNFILIESAEVRGSLQPASCMTTIGAQFGYTF